MSNQIKTILFMGILSALLIGFGYLIGPSYAWIFTLVAIAMNLVGYFYSDKIVLKMHNAREITPSEHPNVHRLVHELSIKAEIPKPRIFWIDDPSPNAFATGRNPQNGIVAVTDGLVRLVSERELKGVLAHEIAHIKNRDILIATLASTMAIAISHVSNIIQWSSIFGSNRSNDEDSGPNPLLMAFIAPIAATLIQLAISRSREYMADQLGAQLTSDPKSLASALLKLEEYSEQRSGHLTQEPATASLFIVNPFAGAEGILRLFSTHPPIKERVRKLQELY